MVFGIGFAAQFGSRMHVPRVDLLNFEISCVHDILLMVSGPLVLYFVTNLMLWVHMDAYGCIWVHMEAIFIYFHRFSSVVNDFSRI